MGRFGWWGVRKRIGACVGVCLEKACSHTLRERKKEKESRKEGVKSWANSHQLNITTVILSVQMNPDFLYLKYISTVDVSVELKHVCVRTLKSSQQAKYPEYSNTKCEKVSISRLLTFYTVCSFTFQTSFGCLTLISSFTRLIITPSRALIKGLVLSSNMDMCGYEVLQIQVSSEIWECI